MGLDAVEGLEEGGYGFGVGFFGAVQEEVR